MKVGNARNTEGICERKRESAGRIDLLLLLSALRKYENEGKLAIQAR